MMQALLKREARIEGIEQVVLSVTTTMTTAIRLSQSLGFQPFGCERRALKKGDRYFDTEYMRLRMKSPAAGARPRYVFLDEVEPLLGRGRSVMSTTTGRESAAAWIAQRR